MRIMSMHKTDAATEAGALPTPELMAGMAQRVVATPDATSHLPLHGAAGIGAIAVALRPVVH